MSVKRYNPTVTLTDDDKAIVHMIPADDGIVIKWGDHWAEFERWQAAARKAEQVLLEEIERLTAEDAAILNANSAVIAERDAAVRELERRTAWWDEKVSTLNEKLHAAETRIQEDPLGMALAAVAELGPLQLIQIRAVVDSLMERREH